MSLVQLIALLGLDEVARRAGVTTGTLKKWVRVGPSARGAAEISAVARRYLAAKKAAKTRKESAKFRESIEPPEEAVDIDPEEALPKRPPQLSPEVAQLKRAEGIREGQQRIESEFNIGYTVWVRVGEDVREVSAADLAAQAWLIYEESALDYVSVKFLFLRYIPFNPTYKGEMLKKQGKWHEQWISTKAVSARRTLTNYIEYYIEHSQKWAETRVIFLEMIGVSVFNRKREMPTAQQVINKPLRTSKQ